MMCELWMITFQKKHKHSAILEIKKYKRNNMVVYILDNQIFNAELTEDFP